MEPFGEPLTTSAQTIYTCPVGKTARILGCQVASVHASNDVDVTVQWTDASEAGQVTRLAHNVTISPRDAVDPIASVQGLAAGDSLQALASANGHAEISITVVEVDV